MLEFKILKKDSDSRARVGVIETPHGFVETPAYTIVGTNAAVRTLTPEDLRETKTQIVIVNTYHLWKDLNGTLDAFEGLHKKMRWEGPVMTDSGGFQVFSFGFAREHGASKVGGKRSEFSQSFGAGHSPSPADGAALRSRLAILPEAKRARLRALLRDGEDSSRNDKNVVKVTEEGVFFSDGEERFLDPETSIHIQEKLGADIIFAFDECTSPLNDYAYTKQSMDRTHRWAQRSLDARTRNDQALYGIIQGGRYEDLRKESSGFIGGLPFDGFGIGGSFGKNEMRDMLRWTIPFFPEGKPRHLLGIGRIEDILNAVELGVDTFDCVIPTREARHGSVWTARGRYDVKKGISAGDKKPLEKGCGCPACAAGVTRGKLHDLFKEHNWEAGRLATIHNVWFFNDFMRQVREAIQHGQFTKFKRKTLAKLTDK